MSFHIREVTPEDCPLLVQLIRELADYERLAYAMQATPDDLHRSLFIERAANAVLAYEADQPIGFALYFFNYSTFVGRKGLYLEDLYVRPEFRGKGYGKALLLHLVEVAQKEQCGRMEWSVLNWNTPAIDFYNSLGAQAMNEWTVYRLNPDQFKQ